VIGSGKSDLPGRKVGWLPKSSTERDRVGKGRVVGRGDSVPPGRRSPEEIADRFEEIRDKQRPAGYWEARRRAEAQADDDGRERRADVPRK